MTKPSRALNTGWLAFTFPSFLLAYHGSVLRVHRAYSLKKKKDIAGLAPDTKHSTFNTTIINMSRNRSIYNYA